MKKNIVFLSLIGVLVSAVLFCQGSYANQSLLGCEGLLHIPGSAVNKKTEISTYLGTADGAEGKLLMDFPVFQIFETFLVLNIKQNDVYFNGGVKLPLLKELAVFFNADLPSFGNEPKYTYAGIPVTCQISDDFKIWAYIGFSWDNIIELKLNPNKWTSTLKHDDGIAVSYKPATGLLLYAELSFGQEYKDASFVIKDTCLGASADVLQGLRIALNYSPDIGNNSITKSIVSVMLTFYSSEK